MVNITPHQKKALNYKEHISLTANAGSGKTFVLSRRFVEIAMNENIFLKNIVAITFTEKAASELYKKVSDEVNSRYLSSIDEVEKRKLERLRQQLVSANISTIHSFCIGILREYPIESKVDANFVAIEPNTSDELIQLSIEEVIKKRLDNLDKSGDVKHLIRIFASRHVLSSILSTMINKRKNIIRTVSLIYSKTIENISDFFYSEFKKHLINIIEKNKIKICNNVSIINEAVLDQNPDNATANEIKILIKQLLIETNIEIVLENLTNVKDKFLTKNLEVRKQGYLKKNRELYAKNIKELGTCFSEICELKIEEDHKTVEYELAKLGKILIDIFKEVSESYSERKRKNGCLDFEDILLLTQNVLRNPKVSNALAEKYKYIMVDEYQDTNEIQYEIFMPILDNLKKGNLFVVGDEKQSIYMFRDAELEVFNKTKVDITQISGESFLLNLPDSFRMAPAICLFTNYLFRRLFSGPDIYFNEVDYNDLVCGKDELIPGGIEILLSDPDDISEAELVARRIIQLKDSLPEKIEFSEIAVLCRKRKSFQELEKVFNKYKIPYNIMAGKGFYQRQLVNDIFNYLSFLFNPNDDSALVGILRSPFFSISDSEIFNISLVQKENYWEKFKTYAPGNEKYSKIYELLSENIILSNQLDLTSLLRKITGETNFIAVLSAKTNYEQELANLEKLINISSSFNVSGHKTVYDFIVFLDNAINSLEDEGQASISNMDNSIKIMTLHQAKGLEYKGVFLYSCHDYPFRDTVKAKSISINKEFGLLTTVPVNNNFFEDYKAAPIVALHNYIIKKKNIAEIKRLFYVGVTRAKNYLFISGLNKDFRYPQESFLNLLFEGLDVDLLTEKVTINDKLTFLKSNGSGYFNETKLLKVEIPIITSIAEPKPFEPINIFEEAKSKKLKIQQIDDQEKDEIITATRFTVYNQCSLKYQLTYELGYLKLFRNLSTAGNSVRSIISTGSNEFAFMDLNRKEEKEIFNLADIKGKVLHQILEMELTIEMAEEQMDRLIFNELEFVDWNETNLQFLKSELLNDLKYFYSSDAFLELKKFNDYKNSFEIFSKENDYFLHGIINKLIFFENKILMVDYKTDNISSNDVTKRALKYDRQINFYGFLVQKLFGQNKQIESWLVFTRCSSIVKKELKLNDIERTKEEIKTTVYNIRTGKFFKNLDHCRICYYYKDSHCIVE